MSSLIRYKKAGGFVQLLSLLETFGPQKREKFLEMIEAESGVWAKALREKMLTLERIFSWNDQIVIEIFKSLPPKNLGLALEGIKPEFKARLLPFFTPSEKRRLDDAIAGATPKPEEVASNLVKVIEMTRKMLLQGDLRAEKFDSGLIIPENFETKLEGPGDFSNAPTDPQELKIPAQMLDPGQAPNLEVVQIQRTLATALNENKTLKEEIKVLRGKLDQIRKIA